MQTALRNRFCRYPYFDGMNDWTRLDNGTLPGKGSLSIFALERILGIDVENEELDLQNTDWVGGLMMIKLGNMLREGQHVKFQQFDIVVKKMNGPRIVLLRVYPADAIHPEDAHA